MHDKNIENAPKSNDWDEEAYTRSRNIINKYRNMTTGPLSQFIGKCKASKKQAQNSNTAQSDNSEKVNFVEKFFAVSYMIKGALAEGKDLDYVKRNSIFCDPKVFREAVCKGTDMQNVCYITEGALDALRKNNGVPQDLLIMSHHKKVGIKNGIEHIIPVCYLLEIFWNIIEKNYMQSNLKNIIEQEYDKWVLEAFITKAEDTRLTQSGLRNAMPINGLPNIIDKFSRYRMANIHLYEIDWAKTLNSSSLVLKQNPVV